jgi:glycosyltransferase A (GT-A) superfamily protein (DUF2064 family)
LGARLERILCRGLQRFGAALALGADSPGLPSARVVEAVRLLEEHEAVVGPSDDGGYYLLGLRRCPPGLLSGLPWSAAETCGATLARLRQWGLSVALLPSYFDMDTPEDLHQLESLLGAGTLVAPATCRALGEVRRSTGG